MDGKLSKTAKASMKNIVKRRQDKFCPACKQTMVATRVVKTAFHAGRGMYWICNKCGHRERVCR